MRHTGAEDKSYAHLMGALLRTKPAMETRHQRGGWVGLTLSVRISASAYGMQVTPHNEQAGSQKPLVLHGFTKLGGPEKGGFGDYKPRRLKLIVCSSPYRATRN